MRPVWCGAPTTCYIPRTEQPAAFYCVSFVAAVYHEVESVGNWRTGGLKPRGSGVEIPENDLSRLSLPRVDALRIAPSQARRAASEAARPACCRAPAAGGEAGLAVLCRAGRAQLGELVRHCRQVVGRDEGTPEHLLQPFDAHVVERQSI